MTFYISFFAVVFLLTMAGTLAFGRTSIKPVILPLILIVLFAALRGNVGTDTFAYKSYFNSFGTSEFNAFALEPLFTLFAYLINLIWPNDQFFIACISLVTGVLIYYNLKLVDEKSLFFLYFFSVYFVMLNLNLMRFGIALLIISNGYLLYLKGGKSKLSIYFFGFLTHFATLFTLLLLINKKHGWKVIGFLGVFFFILGNVFFDKLRIYLLLGAVSMGHFSLDFGLLFETLILIIIFWINRKRVSSGLILMLVTYILLRNLAFLFDMLQRFAYIAGLLLYLHFFSKRQNLYTRLLLTLFIVFNIYKSLMFLQNSDAAINQLLAIKPGFRSLYSQTKWLPYRFFWER